MLNFALPMMMIYFPFDTIQFNQLYLELKLNSIGVIILVGIKLVITTIERIEHLYVHF